MKQDTPITNGDSVLPQAERNAYAAAHRIFTTDLWCNFAAKGRQRTHAVDMIARIIIREFREDVHDVKGK